MTAQHPATETDANGLTEAERASLWEAIERAFLDTTAWSREVEDEIDRTVERIVAERVRVVEGERDAAVEYGRRACLICKGAAEEATARAESAEAAHEAEKAAHERLRAEVRALADEYANADIIWRNVGSRLRALLAGGGAR